jgi:GTP-binding protein YchF
MVGLPNVGKSTLFNAIMNAEAASANYPFSTIEANVGAVSVPDERLEWLAELYRPQKITPATLEFVDIAGLVSGSSKGEGLGNKFLGSIREVDALVHVVRCFENSEIVHVSGDLGPSRDIETINLELIFADLDILERRIERTAKALKGDKNLSQELDFLGRLKTHLEEGKSARSLVCDGYEEEILATMPLLSRKPVIYVANLGEGDFKDGVEKNPYYQQVKSAAETENAGVLAICAGFEADIAGMEPEDKLMFLAEIGLESSGLDRMIQAGYELLELISYLTAGGKNEVRAWTIKRGTLAPQAAGKIHTDFERGFIRAEVVAFHDLKSCGNMNAAKDKGLVRLEGKSYEIKNGDVVLFRFNV